MANWIVAIATSIQVFILLAAVCYAKKQVGEAKALRESQTQPYVVVSFQTDKVSHQLLVLKVENLGTTVAKNINISVNPHFQSTLSSDGEEDRFEKWIILKPQGIATLVPGQSIEYIVDALTDRLNSDLDKQYEVTVTYSNEKRDKDYSFTYSLDINMWWGSPNILEKTLKHVVESIDKLRLNR